jgi:hypothetical protein
MEQKMLSELTDEELLKEAKRVKSYKLYDALFFGLLTGIAIYSSAANGFGFLTFIPLIYLPIAAKNKEKHKKLEKLIKERKIYKQLNSYEFNK